MREAINQWAQNAKQWVQRKSKLCKIFAAAALVVTAGALIASSLNYGEPNIEYSEAKTSANGRVTTVIRDNRSSNDPPDGMIIVIDNGGVRDTVLTFDDTPTYMVVNGEKDHRRYEKYVHGQASKLKEKGEEVTYSDIDPYSDFEAVKGEDGVTLKKVESRPTSAVRPSDSQTYGAPKAGL